MEVNELIKEIEQLNADCIRVENSSQYISGHNLLKLKKDGLPGLIASVLRRRKFAKVQQYPAEINMPKEVEIDMARLGDPNKRIVVYTCITNGYDLLQTPYIMPENISYIYFSDKPQEIHGWEYEKIPDVALSQKDAMINRYIKFHPYELFGRNYDYAIYIDGNILPISDLSVLTELVNSESGIAFHRHCARRCIYEEIKACKILKKGDPKKLEEQCLRYKNEGFPKDYGMIEGNLIVYDLKSERAHELSNILWNELVHSESGRDQMAWPYVLWKNDISIETVATLGLNIYKNPKVRISQHVK